MASDTTRKQRIAAAGGLTGLLLVVGISTTSPTVLPFAVLAGFMFTAGGWGVGYALGELRVSSITLCLIPILGVSCAGLMVAANANHTRSQYLLRADGVRTQATVIESRPHDHNTIVWRYDTPSGERRAAGGAPHDRAARDLVPGDRIEVTYSRSKPELSTARPPDDTWASEWAGSLWLAIPFVAWVTMGLAWKWRNLNRAE